MWYWSSFTLHPKLQYKLFPENSVLLRGNWIWDWTADLNTLHNSEPSVVTGIYKNIRRLRVVIWSQTINTTFQDFKNLNVIFDIHEGIDHTFVFSNTSSEIFLIKMVLISSMIFLKTYFFSNVNFQKSFIK